MRKSGNLLMRKLESPARLAAFGLAAGLVLAPAASGATDDSVRSRLDLIGYKYEVDKDGDYKLVINYAAEKRSQLVWVSGGTETYDTFRVREIYSPAGRLAADGINGTKALDLLLRSGKTKLGDWEIRGDGLYYAIKLPEPITADQLHSAIKLVAETADNMEIELSGSRDAL